METTRRLIEIGAFAVETLGALVILIAVAYGTVRYLIHFSAQVSDAFEQFKRHLAKALLLALEFLVAADIIRTVALEATLGNITNLGLLVIVRTFLSWALVVETEGRWPWRARRTSAERIEAQQPIVSPASETH